MSLRDRDVSTGRVYSLRVDEILADLDDDDRIILEVWLNDPTVPASRIAHELTDEGYQITDGSVRKWRRRNGVS